jgi:hypothetical protein
MSVKSNRSSNPGQNPGEKNFASHRRKLPRSLQEWPNPLRYFCENKSCHQSVKLKWDFLMRAPSVKEFIRFFWKGNRTGCPAWQLAPCPYWHSNLAPIWIPYSKIAYSTQVHLLLSMDSYLNLFHLDKLDLKSRFELQMATSCCKKNIRPTQSVV